MLYLSLKSAVVFESGKGANRNFKRHFSASPAGGNPQQHSWDIPAGPWRWRWLFASSSPRAAVGWAGDLGGCAACHPPGIRRWPDPPPQASNLAGRRASCGRGPRLTDGALRTGTASGRNPPAAVSASAEVATEWERSGTLDFVGFTCYWARAHKGHWRMACTTRQASLRRAKMAIYDWCRRHRHGSITEQHAALHRRLRGHVTDFGVRGNSNSMMRRVEDTKRSWYKWLCRRSQRTRLNWERCTDMLRWWPLPRPRITVRMWDGSPRATSTEEPDGGHLLVRIW
jgi:hypothetical protein